MVKEKRVSGLKYRQSDKDTLQRTATPGSLDTLGLVQNYSVPLDME
jgi:hypothetical protein